MIVTTWIRILSGLGVVAWWRPRMAHAWDFNASRIDIQIDSTFICYFDLRHLQTPKLSNRGNKICFWAASSTILTEANESVFDLYGNPEVPTILRVLQQHLGTLDLLRVCGIVSGLWLGAAGSIGLAVPSRRPSLGACLP